MRCRTLIPCTLMLGFGAIAVRAQLPPPKPEAIAKVQEAAPDKPAVKPEKPRKLLVFTLCRGFPHPVIPLAAEAFKILGSKSGAYEAVVSDDIARFEPDALKPFDAVCMLNTTGELFLPPDFNDLLDAEKTQAQQRDARLKKSLLDFVKGGKGLVGIHAATDCFYQWPEYGELMGGYFDFHPWNEEVFVKLDEPNHPLVAMFEGQPFSVADEIYQFKDPYSRQRLRVLLSLDTSRTNMKKDGIKRADKDFAVSWVREYGAGRVFYCSLGHRDDVFWNPKVLRHYLAGIQFAFGDLPAPATPLAPAGGGPATPPQTGGGAALTPPPPDAGPAWTPLFNGRDLTGWKGLVGEPKSRAAMNPADLAKAQAAADDTMHAHWKVEDGTLVFDGRGESLCTAKDYGDLELKVDWKIEPGGDSGIYLRGSPQVQIWDAAQNTEGSGGLYNNEHNPSKPLIRADKPAGQWNSFRIEMIGPIVSVWLNDQLVTDRAVLENYWERDKPIYSAGQIELQSHGTRLCFRNLMIRDVPAERNAAVQRQPAWRELFNGHDLSGWTCKPEAWIVEDGALARQGGSDIWTTEPFGDFVLDAEFKVSPEANSGILFRTADTKDCVQTGIELQVLDSFGKEPPDKGACGAIYDCLAPSKNAARPAGQWNHVVLTCQGSRIGVVLNGDRIIDMNLDQWTQAGKNPDGTPNKYRTAYKDMPRRGYIGFQDHGHPVWCRNIRLRPLAE
jgi:type 1 glutamine amidotransferase